MHQDSFVRTPKELRFVQTYDASGRPGGREERTYRCSAAGLRPADTPEMKFEGVQYGSDVRPGSKWKFNFTLKQPGFTTSATYDYTVVGKERVARAVGPAVEATRVDYTGIVTSSTRSGLPPIHGSMWLAEGVGMVKQVEEDAALTPIPQRRSLELLPQ